MTNGIAESLAQSQECINMLESCSVSDYVAMEMLNIVRPLHQELQRLASRDTASDRSGIYDLLQIPHSASTTTSGHLMSQQASANPNTVRTAAIPAMQNAIEVLGNPFGHERRLNIDTFSRLDPDVPSWWN